MSYLKGDAVNGAYEELRISGLTVQAGPAENTKALKKLEAMANEYFNRDICISYNFEENPDLNTESGVPPEYQNALEICLAYRLISTFGKGQTPDPILIKNQRGAFSYLSSATAVVKTTQPSPRFPIGSGNTMRGQRYNRFYKPVVDNTSCDTIEFTQDPDAKENYGIDWLSWLEGATILTSEWDVESGITGYNETFDSTSTGIWFQGGTNGGRYRATNSITASDGRQTDRTIIINTIDK